MKDKTASERIRKAREEIGLTAEQVAQRLSLSVAWYHDLESYSDEVFSNISLAHLQLLAGIIRIEPRHIANTSPQSEWTISRRFRRSQT